MDNRKNNRNDDYDDKRMRGRRDDYCEPRVYTTGGKTLSIMSDEALCVNYICGIDAIRARFERDSIRADSSPCNILRHPTTSYDIVGGAMHIWPVNLQLL